MPGNPATRRWTSKHYAAFGFLVAYFLITVATAVYLGRLGELRTQDRLGCGAALALLVVPAVGSVYPVPSAPVMCFPYVFLAHLLVGMVWIFAFYRAKPAAGGMIRSDLESAHRRIRPTSPMAATPHGAQ